MIKIFKILSGIYDTMCLATTKGHIKKTKPFSSKNVHQKYFTVNVLETWNSLPYDIVNAKTVNLKNKKA